MKFSIITPSFRNSNWLKLCIASVADQQGVEAEHIVQDSCSDDGTQDWLLQDKRVKAFIEKDSGMYDAVNRGLRRATGDILAYLNCDEQYLPGALHAVAEFFETNPHVDIVFADSIIINADGNYICHRKVLVPLKYHSQVCTLGVLSSAMFFRRTVLEKYGLFFNTQWRDFGDVDWVLRALNQSAPMAVLRRFTSAFADTGENMNLKPNARREAKLMVESAPRLAQKLATAFKVYHRLRRLLHGIYFQKPFSFSIYTPRSPDKRVTVRVDKPTFIWKGRI
ncbi:MAG TPA: glycosyltransferase family 2 protein [Methylomirabilota bacterium]|nr:glycosyltransferase family 2 protein [Methylomirabilota bacterium]